jgi:hypothetical protein
MVNRSKIVGTRWETEGVRVLREEGASAAERRALAGILDRGDIAGMPGVVWEMKAEVRIDLAGWIAEVEAERRNDGSDVGIVWAKRRGRTSGRDGYMIMTPGVGFHLLRAGGYLPELAA